MGKEEPPLHEDNYFGQIDILAGDMLKEEPSPEPKNYPSETSSTLAKPNFDQTSVVKGEIEDSYSCSEDSPLRPRKKRLKKKRLKAGRNSKPVLDPLSSEMLEDPSGETEVEKKNQFACSRY